MNLRKIILENLKDHYIDGDGVIYLWVTPDEKYYLNITARMLYSINEYFSLSTIINSGRKTIYDANKIIERINVNRVHIYYNSNDVVPLEVINNLKLVKYFIGATRIGEKDFFDQMNESKDKDDDGLDWIRDTIPYDIKHPQVGMKFRLSVFPEIYTIENISGEHYTISWVDEFSDEVEIKWIKKNYEDFLKRGEIFLTNYLTESKEDDDWSWADEIPNSNRLPDDDETKKDIINRIVWDIIDNKVHFEEFSVSTDPMSGTIHWGSDYGMYYATPNFYRLGEIPVESDERYIGTITTPYFSYESEVIEWYGNNYYKEVYNLITTP